MDRQDSQLRVLLVEDSEDDRFFFQHAFNRAELNARLYIAKDGLEAIEFLKTEAAVAGGPNFPDVVFLDLKMPELDGFDVLRWMHDQSLLALMKVYVLSGSDEPKDIELAKQLGAKKYLVKHVKAQLLRDLLGAPVGSPEHNPQVPKT